MFYINVAMKNRLSNVKEEECWNHWEYKPDPVLSKPEVDMTISFEEMEWLPKSLC